MLPAKPLLLSDADETAVIGPARLHVRPRGHMTRTPLIQLRDVAKTYTVGEVDVQALRGVSLESIMASMSP